MVSDNCNFTISSSPLDFSGDNPGTFQIIVEATDDGGNVSDCLVNVTVDQSSSVIDIANDQRISVYPNPTKNQVNIEIDPSLEAKSIVLYDSSGKRVEERTFAPQLSIADLPKGVYSLAIITAEDVFVTRVLRW